MGGGGGLCVTRNFPLSTAEVPGVYLELRSALERGSEAKKTLYLKSTSAAVTGARSPPTGHRPAGSLCYRHSFPSKSSRNSAILPHRHFPPGLTLFPFVFWPPPRSPRHRGAAVPRSCPPPTTPGPSGHLRGGRRERTLGGVVHHQGLEKCQAKD